MIQVLFVDDEVKVLDGMRRSLHHMRNSWNMNFVLSGDAALAYLATTPADVIVSDMRMPGMDGWQLLAKVKELHPQTVRLILSGHSDPISIMRTVGTAHQYLSKPCDSHELKSAIARTEQLRSLLNDVRLTGLVGHVGTLPSLPRAFQEILTCLQRPNASIGDAAQIIARDVAMTANVMKLVNSAFFGAPQSVRTVERAVAYLGLETLCALVLGHSMFNSAIATSAQKARLEQLLQHSLDTALTARIIARCEKLPVADGEHAYLAGILHDVGRVVIAMQPAAGTVAGSSSAESLAEMEQHHAEIGAYLLGLWGFPSPIVEAVAYHHKPTDFGPAGLTLPRIVHIADQLAQERHSPVPDPVESTLEPDLLQSLGLEDRWPHWVAALDEVETEKVAS